MTVWRYIALIALSILLIAALACGPTEGPAETPTPISAVTAEQIRDQAITADAELDTYQFEVEQTWDVSVVAEGETTDSLMAVNAYGAMDRPSETMYTNMYMTLETLEISGTEHMEILTQAYIVEDWIYKGIEFPPEPATWTKRPLTEEVWEELDVVSQQLDLLSDVYVELVGTEAVDGTECYVLQLMPDMDELRALLQLAGIAEGFPPGLDLAEMVTDLSAMQWLAKDTYFTQKATVNYIMVFTPESWGLPAEPEGEFDATADIATTIIMHHINQPVTIELPPEAAEAEEEPLP